METKIDLEKLLKKENIRLYKDDDIDYSCYYDEEKIKSFIEDVVTLTRIKIIHGTQKKISDLPDTCPANESDEFDSGMRKMKDNVLSIIKEMQNHETI